MSDVALETISDDSSLVHVCTFLVSRHSRLFAEIAAYLSPEERMRAERFYREVDRRRFVLGRAMVRRLCGTHLGVEPETVRLEQTSNGKPYLGCSTEVSQRRLEFNVAHSGDCVLIAWSLGRAVGIDVETLDRNPPALFGDAWLPDVWSSALVVLREPWTGRTPGWSAFQLAWLLSS
jgi:4'-phosphopantetheinyl transferase, N-terminal